MFQKFLLSIILITLGVIIFLIMTLSNKISKINLAMTPAEAPILAKAQSALPVQPKMPAMWHNANDIKKIFLSYDPADFSTAFEVSKLIEKDGSVALVYLAPRQISSLAGEEETINAIKSADAFLILFSQNYEKSAIANQEYGLAIAENKKILTLSPFQMTPEITKYGSEILQITPDNQIILQESILKMLSINGEFESDTKMLKVQEPRVNEIKFE